MQYPFWEKNRAAAASADAYDARKAAEKEKTEKEKLETRLKNVEKFIEELKILLEKGQSESSINSELHSIIKKNLEKLN